MWVRRRPGPGANLNSGAWIVRADQTQWEEADDAGVSETNADCDTLFTDAYRGSGPFRRRPGQPDQVRGADIRHYSFRRYPARAPAGRYRFPADCLCGSVQIS